MHFVIKNFNSFTELSRDSPIFNFGRLFRLVYQFVELINVLDIDFTLLSLYINAPLSNSNIKYIKTFERFCFMLSKS